MGTWQVTLPCRLIEARAMQGDIGAFAEFDPPPALVTSEAQAGGWRLDAYFERRPDRATIALLAALAPSAAGTAPVVARVVAADWVALSQQGLAPIRAGRFFVHTPRDRGQAPADTIPLEIDPGRAFGTGHHETTTGCLIALDRLKARGAVFRDILDMGTGTGLLAFAALKLWPAARAIASDIDPVAIEVARANAAINAVPIGRLPGRLDLAVAPGLVHRSLIARAPYDLITANILAGPLIDLAPAIAAALAPGGRLILAGLLANQADPVSTVYRRNGLAPSFSIRQGDWPTLALRKRQRVSA